MRNLFRAVLLLAVFSVPLSTALPSVASAATFTNGQQVKTTVKTNVRQTPAGKVLGTQNGGAIGVVIGGPTVATLSGTTYTWWDINFNSGVDGWVADNSLAAIPAPTVTLSASPTSINPGQSSKLAWASTNATACSGVNFTASAKSGSVTVKPTQTTTYSITCTGPGGTSPAASVTVTVITPPPPVPTATLSASPTSITTGQSSTLSWSSTNATSCSGVNFTATTTSGSAAVTPSQSTTYSITCSGAGGVSPVASATVTVTVPDTQAPSIPANLSASAISSSQISLTWAASSDNIGVAGYNVFRNGTAVGTAATNSYTDSGLVASTTYSYTVSAFDAAGNTSGMSSSTSAMTQGASSGGNVCPMGSAYADGCSAAPANAVPFPNILSGYTVRPAWNVAGVDYAVGITPGTVLKDPATINLPGVSISTASHMVTVTGSNVTLNGYDFSLGGGWSVDDLAPNLTISNSNFKIGANQNYTIYGDNGSSNLSVINCVIDGNFTNDRLNDGLIYTGTPGLTVMYSLLKNSVSDMIEAQGGGVVTIKYNVLNNNGSVNAHPDWLQTFASTPYTESIMYNTAYQTNFGSTDGTQGWMLNDNGAVITNAELAYNTVVSGPGAKVSPVTTVNGGSGVTGVALIHDNYADSRGGTFGNEAFFSDPSYFAKGEYYNNINMATGGLYVGNVGSGLPTPAPLMNSSIAPIVNTLSLIPPTPSITSTTVSGNTVTIKGAGSVDSWPVPNYTVEIFDGSTPIGVANSSSGTWSFTSGALPSGTHIFTAKTNDFWGYPSTASGTSSATIAYAGGTSSGYVALPSGNIFLHTLAKSWTGPEVSALQTVLSKLGYFAGEATGYFGAKTEAAVIDFQSGHNLPKAGVVGPKTRAVLNSLGL